MKQVEFYSSSIKIKFKEFRIGVNKPGKKLENCSATGAAVVVDISLPCSSFDCS